MKKQALLAGLFFMVCACTQAQESVFQLFRKEVLLADDYYIDKKYRSAFQVYARLYRNDSSSTELPMKMARCAYHLKEYRNAAMLFKKCASKNRTADDSFYFGESLAFGGHTNEAIAAYDECRRKQPNRPLIAQKIWQLRNIQFLYEDSLHYAVRVLPLNTASGEFSPVPFDDGIIFISNRKERKMVEKIDASINTPFYQPYFSKPLPNVDKNGLIRYKEPVAFNKDFYSGFHAGPISFYDRQRKMVFASAGEKSGSEGKHILQLFFAAEEKGKWKITAAFPYNSLLYSLTDPSINEEGTLLYFSSNMKEGKGGKDIYRSFFNNGEWSKPENLGESINTPYDEAFPFLHQDKTLYFSSNGHAGMGGLDIFKSELAEKGFGEVLNVGYPINSNADEFGITIDSLNSHGYFSSNRRHGGYDDDLYEVDIDLQTYPLEIAGWMGLKEHNWTDSTKIETFAHARFSLIDNLREVVVQEGTSDEEGNFTWIIPYFSKYRMRVVGPDKEEHTIIVEIPKQKQLHGKHEIVIVKDLFRLN